MCKSVSKYSLFYIFSLLLILVAVMGCGGGSAGTGTTTFTGKLLTPDNKPVEGATIRVVGSNEVATTDEKGQFTLSAQDQNLPVEIQVQSDGVAASVIIPAATADESKIGVQLELDTDKSTLSVRSLEVKVTIVGECGRYFLKNQDSFQQIRALPDLTRCTVRVAANSGNRPVGGILADVQRTSCNGIAEDGDSWISVASGRTKESGSRGKVDIDFTFFDDDAHCQYRVVAPSKDRSRAPLIFSIVTLRQQSQ